MHVPLNLSLLLFLSFFSLSPLPQPSPGQSITKQVDTLVSAMCWQRLLFTLRPYWALLVPIPQPKACSLSHDPPLLLDPYSRVMLMPKVMSRGLGVEAFAAKPAFLSVELGICFLICGHEIAKAV